MRQIRISLTRTGGSGPEPLPNGSFQLWYPTASKVLPDSYQLPGADRVDLVDGEALTIKVETDSYMVWAVQTFVYDELGSSVNYKIVPSGNYDTILEFEDLVEVDPDTLLVAGAPTPLWVAEVTELQQLLESRPDILVLDVGSPIPDGLAPNTIILRKSA